MRDVLDELIAAIFVDEFKPLKWRKQKGNFRFIGDDGLGKIINFQRSKWNNNIEDNIEFYINYGLYIETNNAIANKTFKEYDCQFRNRTSFLRGHYQIDKHANIISIKTQIMPAVKEAIEFFNIVPSKEKFVQMLLSGDIQKYTATPVMHYYTCKLLYEMGYGREIYGIVKSAGGKYFDELAKLIEQTIEK